MKNSKVLFQELVAGITLKESSGELESIALFLMEHALGLSRTEILSGKMMDLTADRHFFLRDSLKRINAGVPIQYVLGFEYFYGRKFHVNPSVLIPRPETEELIRVVLDFNKQRAADRQGGIVRILDIGTGSGCIPVTLFHEVGEVKLYASDVSHAALSVAVKNSQSHGAEIDFMEHDILKEDIPLSGLDIVLSNPPYVTENEKGKMNANVLNYEPHLALFVPDDDPLLFYHAIVVQASRILKPGGLLAVEINENYDREVSLILSKAGFGSVCIEQDIAGKPRVVHGQRRALP